MEKDKAICTVCRKVPPIYAAAAYGSYDSILRELLHLLKYEKVRPASTCLGGMLAQVIAAMESRFEPGTIVVIPVPLHSGKRRQRAFNQAEVIARAALKSGRSGRRFRLEPRLLERRRATASQIGLSQNQRRENLRGAFKVAKPERLKGNQVLLVDDVFTTGTTVSECARALRRAGATKVFVATVARTLKTSIHGIERLEQVPIARAG